MLSSGELFGHFSSSGELITCAGLFPYGGALASVGAVMVRPDFQRRGLGQRLMTHIHDHPIAQERTLMLVATDQGIPLYTRMGYREAGPLRKMVAPGPLPGMPSWPRGLEIRPVGDADIDDVVELDANAFGGDRRALIFARWRQSCSAAIALDGSGDPIGFAFATNQRGQRILGPLVAPSAEIALHLLHSVSEQHQGQLRVDILEDQQDLSSALSGAGFRPETRPPLLVRNGGGHLRHGPTMWAIAAQAFG